MILKIRGSRENEWLFFDVDRIRVRHISGKDYNEGWGIPDRLCLGVPFAIDVKDDKERPKFRDDRQLVWANISHGKTQDYTIAFDTVAFLCNDDGRTIERLVPRDI